MDLKHIFLALTVFCLILSMSGIAHSIQGTLAGPSIDQVSCQVSGPAGQERGADSPCGENDPDFCHEILKSPDDALPVLTLVAYSPIISTLESYQPFQAIPEVYRAIFVPPQNLS